MAAGVGGCYDGPDWISAPSFSSLGDCPQVGDDRPTIWLTLTLTPKVKELYSV
jgi:hypothetical protein